MNVTIAILGLAALILLHEAGHFFVARAVGSVRFPARFQLVGTMNLCPCGARGDPGAQCSCSAQRLARYRDKLSRALLDRFDLVVTVPRARAVDLQGGPGEVSESVRVRVVAARIRLAEAELESLAGELSHILDWVEQLNEVDTTGVPPMASSARRR